MSNAIFPSLSGETFPRIKTPRFSTSRQVSDSLRAWKVARALYPLYTYKLVYSVLDLTDFNTLIGFFKSRKGDFDSFLLDDRDDNTVASPQVFGTGDGTTRSFQLVRSLGGFLEPVGPINGTITVRKAGVATTAFTVDDWGLLTFTTAPANGASLDWTGAYYWRVCFAKSEQEFSEFVRQLWELKTVELETVKP